MGATGNLEFGPSPAASKTTRRPLPVRERLLGDCCGATGARRSLIRGILRWFWFCPSCRLEIPSLLLRSVGSATFAGSRLYSAWRAAEEVLLCASWSVGYR